MVVSVTASRNSSHIPSASLSERSGAVSDNSSSKGLQEDSSEHLSHRTLAYPNGAAKVNKMEYCLTIPMLHKACENGLLGEVSGVE